MDEAQKDEDNNNMSVDIELEPVKLKEALLEQQEEEQQAEGQEEEEGQRVPRREGSSNLMAAVVQIKAICGVGILSFPYAMREGGLLAVPLCLGIVLLVYYTMALLVKVKVRVNKERAEQQLPPLTTYEDISHYVLGTWGYCLTLAAILGTQLGICCRLSKT